jgi:hypothetical protein
MEFEEKLKQLLLQKRQIDLEIEKLITENYLGGIRFSSKKFVGDLGELYFYQQAKIFSKLSQSQTSNNEHDFSGSLLPEFQELFELDNALVRVEIKTRHAQLGNNHLKGINIQKSDLVAFVALDNDFQCRHIGIIKSSDITVDRQNRIRYTDYYNRGLVRWETNQWVEL